MADLNRSPLGRRTLLRGAGGGVVAATWLVACGDDEEPAASSDGDDGGDGATAVAATAVDGGDGGRRRLGPRPRLEVAVGSGVIYADQKIVVTQPTKGEFKGFSAICKHAGCTVGSIEGDEIVCPCHGSRYSIVDGSPTAGPNGEPPSVIDPLDPAEVAVEGKNLVEP